MSQKLKLKLIVLSLIFPISMAFIGFLSCLFYNNYITIISFTFAALIIGIFINIICYYRKIFTILIYKTPLPVSLFLLLWWFSNSFLSSLVSLLIGLAGLATGLFLNYVLVQPVQFYHIKKRILGLIYLFFSIAFMGFFMGVPIFNLLLGVLAANYLSIRVLSNKRDEKNIMHNLKQGAVFTALVLMLMFILSFCCLNIDYSNYISFIDNITPINVKKINLPLVFFILSLIIVLVQYYLTLFAAKTMVEFRKFKKGI